MKRVMLGVAVIVAVAVAVAPLASATPRSGTLRVDKECSGYTGLPGSYCTFTSSNVDWAPARTNIFYLQPDTNSKMSSSTRRVPVPTGRSAIALSLTGSTATAHSPEEQGSSLTSRPRSP